MNREIKFRAWVTPNKDCFFFNMEPYMATQCDPDLETLQSFMHHYGDLENLMQYTGLKDKNGKEIYEGDIIRSISHTPSNYQIEFIEGGFCATNKVIDCFPIDINHFYPSVGTDIEVIGNVHQNPELL